MSDYSMTMQMEQGGPQVGVRSFQGAIGDIDLTGGLRAAVASAVAHCEAKKAWAYTLYCGVQQQACYADRSPFSPFSPPPVIERIAGNPMMGLSAYPRAGLKRKKA